MLNTCKNTQIPPQPKRKEVIIKLIEMALIWTLDIRLIPFVISKRPVIIGEIKDESTCKKLNKGVMHIVSKFKIPEELKIEIIHAKITIKPPIIKIVDVADFILSEIISPKFEKEIISFVEELLYLINIEFEEEDFFQNLNIIPTVIEEKKWVIKSKIPIKLLPNIEIPTVPIIKRGPELFVKLSNLSASILVHKLFFCNSHAIFAPIGYPLIIPIMKAKAHFPFTLNIGFIIFLNNNSKYEIIGVCINKFVATKNGNSEGITFTAHKCKLFLTAKILELENISKDNVNSIKIIGKIAFLNLKVINVKISLLDYKI